MGRQAIKIVSLFAQQIIVKTKPLILLQSANWKIDSDLLHPILSDLELNFNSYFSDINTTFANIGANEWLQANTSVQTMQEFAKSLNQVDETINYDYWNPIVEVWNKFKPPSL